MEEMVLWKRNELEEYEALDEEEKVRLQKAASLLDLGYPEHSLIEVWNAAIHNLRRRVEAYSIDMFLAILNQNKGRNRYNKDGDSLPERWEGVDDILLIQCAKELGLLTSKAEKALSTIDWMRNHASAAHDSAECVTNADVMGLSMIICGNLFAAPMPELMHSPAVIIEAVKKGILTEEQIDLFKQQIVGYSNKEIQVLFGFFLNGIKNGEEPLYGNSKELFPSVWEKASDELRNKMGRDYYDYIFYPESDVNNEGDMNCRGRVYEMLVKVDGIRYVPEAGRIGIYKKLAGRLRSAKNTMYGWRMEEGAAVALQQVGPHVPASVFDEVYQEILRVYCGNYWGRSEAHTALDCFIFNVQIAEKLRIAKLFLYNDEVKEELSQVKPNAQAVSLLERIKDSLTVASNTAEIDRIIFEVKKLL